MKALVFVLALTGLTQAASAALYDCGVPKTASGEIRMGGSSYQVQVTHSKVYLIASNADTGRLRQTKVEMTEDFHGVDAASYSADGIVVNWTNGAVTLTEGNSFAMCKPAHAQN